ncbi:hypothetical protein RND81_01G026500 [Saponaria officinalis]|uniref:Replication protein A 70 kDa DNA-binding subunit B/D first OB fold domain-containing protein n=1 Tax=Saponaria officinalis TaxID=3572 RepID=A0AAW1NC74_SAPOF
MAITPILTINQLDQGVRLTQMNVRVIHKWTRPDIKDKTKTDAIELLLVDTENNIVQATIRRQLISFFASKMVVGKTYNIRNLTVGNNTGLDRATPNPCRIRFEFSSKVQETSDTSIPVHGYWFAKFEDIINGIIPTTHYIVELPVMIFEQPNPNQSKIIMMQCVETKKFEGQWRIQTTYNASAFQINPDIPEAGFYYTHAKIVDLDCTAGWYYDSCKLCWAKITKNDKGRWKCTRDGCDGNSSGLATRVPRFQVKFLVSDLMDDEAEFVIFDSQITQFIKHTAAELLAKLEKDGDQDSIPRELEAFIDKWSFVFKIEIHNKYNVCNRSHSYTVLLVRVGRTPSKK